ncbi:unnamed protein product [Linum trigynum]|uniref:Secreted protein n=1 Tax=Linum trigynum TaxID=586398 RepID=A0AAV2FA38_9ROSI
MRGTLSSLLVFGSFLGRLLLRIIGAILAASLENQKIKRNGSREAAGLVAKGGYGGEAAQGMVALDGRRKEFSKCRPSASQVHRK